LIKHIGLSNVSPEQLRAARSIVEIAAVTAHYNVVARQEAELLEAATEAGLVFSPWQPVSLSTPGAPIDTAGPEAARRVIEPIAARHGATGSQIALAWLLAQSPAMMPVPGTTNLAHVRENLAAQDLELSAEDLQAIKGIASAGTATQSDLQETFL
jgi:aryl-alcohol dehydrogenase-like predicted oxidoreductase